MNNKIHSLALLVNLGIYGVALPAMAEDQTDSVAVSHEDTIVVTAAQQNLQAPGVSTITADEIRKNPPARDVSEIIRTMPGVNLTGNSTSGQRGNNRQIFNNITNFGCFVDIGIKENGLVHISQLADKFVSDPTTVVSMHQHVRVCVLSIDHERKRIQLTMKGLN